MYTSVPAALAADLKERSRLRRCLAVLWLILSLVDQLHLIHLPPRQQCPPSSIAIHDARGDGIFSLWLDRILRAAAPHDRCALQSAVAITTSSGDEPYAFSNLHRAVLTRSLPHDSRMFKRYGRRRRCDLGRAAWRERIRLYPRTSQ